jgi:hypothetical protein
MEEQLVDMKNELNAMVKKITEIKPKKQVSKIINTSKGSDKTINVEARVVNPPSTAVQFEFNWMVKEPVMAEYVVNGKISTLQSSTFDLPNKTAVVQCEVSAYSNTGELVAKGKGLPLYLTVTELCARCGTTYTSPGNSTDLDQMRWTDVIEYNEVCSWQINLTSLSEAEKIREKLSTPLSCFNVDGLLTTMVKGIYEQSRQFFDSGYGEDYVEIEYVRNVITFDGAKFPKKRWSGSSQYSQNGKMDPVNHGLDRSYTNARPKVPIEDALDKRLYSTTEFIVRALMDLVTDKISSSNEVIRNMTHDVPYCVLLYWLKRYYEHRWTKKVGSKNVVLAKYIDVCEKSIDELTDKYDRLVSFKLNPSTIIYESDIKGGIPHMDSEYERVVTANLRETRLIASNVKMEISHHSDMMDYTQDYQSAIDKSEVMYDIAVANRTLTSYKSDSLHKSLGKLSKEMYIDTTQSRLLYGDNNYVAFKTFTTFKGKHNSNTMWPDEVYMIDKQGVVVNDLKQYWKDWSLRRGKSTDERLYAPGSTLESLIKNGLYLIKPTIRSDSNGSTQLRYDSIKSVFVHMKEGSVTEATFDKLLDMIRDYNEILKS